jgi:hypothetical protein
MRRRYRNQGLWGLVDSRYIRMSEPTGQVDPRVVAAATWVVAAQTGTSTGTKSRAITQIRRVLDDEHGPGVVPMPSQATCYRLLDVLAKGRHTFGSAVTRRVTPLQTSDGFQCQVLGFSPAVGKRIPVHAEAFDIRAFLAERCCDEVVCCVEADGVFVVWCAGHVSMVETFAESLNFQTASTAPQVTRPLLASRGATERSNFH